MKWGGSAAGSAGGQVTWSFAQTTGHYQFDYAITGEYQNLIRAAFNAWEAVANIDFVEVADSVNSDIRLGWDDIGDGPYGTVGEAYYSFSNSSGQFDTLIEAEIRFDTAETWSTNGVGGPNFYVVAVHEIGHAIGLGHSSDPSAIMYYMTNSQSGLSPDDIAGIQAIYGAASGTGNGLMGTNGDDYILGTAGPDLIVAYDGDDVVEALGGNDTVYAGAGDLGDDIFYGGEGNDILGGGAGHDTLYGENGDDTIFGGSGDDDLLGGNGADVIWAGLGIDLVYGGAGNDILGGGAGSDSIYGEGGHDVIYGGPDGGYDFIDGGDNNDTIYAGAGNDTLYGGSGDDVLFNGAGSDYVYGEGGNDWLWGGAGNDVLNGGTGADWFSFEYGTGNDTVSDFAPEEGDVLDLYDFGYISEAEVLSDMYDVSGGVSLDLGAGGTVLLVGVTKAELAGSPADWLYI